MKNSDLSIPEYTLCKILKDTLTEGEVSEIAKASSDVWEAIYKISQHNRLLPLLYHKIKTHKILVSEKLERRLKNNAFQFAFRELKRKRQLKELVDIFNRHNISHILLKGSHLSEKIYSSSMIRTMCDIDVLIKENECKKAYNILINEGYSPKAIASSPAVKETYVHHLPSLAKEGGVSVELHRYLFENNDFDNIQKVWARACKESIGTCETMFMSAEDLLIYIALHGMKYHTLNVGIRFLVDINAIVKFYPINWNRIKILIENDDWGNRKTIFSVLFLSKKLLGTSVPDSFLSEIKPNDFDEEKEKLLEKLLFHQVTQEYIKAYTYSFYIHYAIKKKSIRVLLNQTFCSSEGLGMQQSSRSKSLKLILIHTKNIGIYTWEFIKNIIINPLWSGNVQLNRAIKLGNQASIINIWLDK